MKSFEYLRPASVSDAIAAARLPGAVYLAAGTNLLDLMKGGVSRPDVLVDVTRLPDLFRATALFWEQSDRFAEVRPWIEQTLAGVNSMPVNAQAELLWFALFNANEMGDNDAAQAAGRRLAPLLAQIEDPQLLGVARLALAWILPITGDCIGIKAKTPEGMGTDNAAIAHAVVVLQRSSSKVSASGQSRSSSSKRHS